MTTYTIEHPTDPEYKGTHGTGLRFSGGRATTDSRALRRYFQNAGYRVDGQLMNAAPAGEVPPVVDPRDHTRPYLQGSPLRDAGDPYPVDTTPIVVGSPLRDALVDPRPGDITATNAGQANPHGPDVVHGDALARWQREQLDAEAAALAEEEALEKAARAAQREAAKKAAPAIPATPAKKTAKKAAPAAK